MKRVHRLRRGWTPPANPIQRRLTDENGQPITFATPGDPTPEERRRYAQALQRATAPPSLTPERQAEVDVIHRRRREAFPHLYND